MFTYRNRKKADEVAKLSAGRLKVVDDKSLYLRLKPELSEETLHGTYELLKRVLGA